MKQPTPPLQTKQNTIPTATSFENILTVNTAARPFVNWTLKATKRSFQRLDYSKPKTKKNISQKKHQKTRNKNFKDKDHEKNKKNNRNTNYKNKKVIKPKKNNALKKQSESKDEHKSSSEEKIHDKKTIQIKEKLNKLTPKDTPKENKEQAKDEKKTIKSAKDWGQASNDPRKKTN